MSKAAQKDTVSIEATDKEWLESIVPPVVPVGDTFSILIVGIGNFVGVKLAEALAQFDFKITGLDIGLSGKKDFLKPLSSYKNIEIIDANYIEKLPAALSKKHFTHIIHVDDVYPLLVEPSTMLLQYQINSEGLRRILDLARDHDTTVVYTSSVDIYQGIASHERVDTYFDGPIMTSYYSFLEAKRYGEALCRQYSSMYGIDVRIARVPEVYGPKMNINHNSVLGTVLHSVMDDVDIVLEEDGSKEHQLIYIDDMVYGLVKLLLDEDQAQHGIFYFTHPERVSTLSIAYTLRQIADKNVEVSFVPSHTKVGFPEPQPIDISRTRRMLHWMPTIDLTEGLERTYSWFAAHYKEEKDRVDAIPVYDEDDSIEISEDSSMSREDDGTEKVSAYEKSKGWGKKMIKTKSSNSEGSIITRILSKVSTIKPYLYALLAIILIVMLPLFVSGAFLARAYFSVRATNFDSAEQQIETAVTVFDIYQWPASLLGVSDYFEQYHTVLSANAYLMRSMEDAYQAYVTLQPLEEQLVSTWNKPDSQSTVTQEELSKIISEAQALIRGAQVGFSLFTSEIKKVDEYTMLPYGREYIQQLKTMTYILEDTLAESPKLIKELPTILGYTEVQRYMVLLQNSNEIRATGGFIGSYMVFDVSGGRVVNVKVDDIYNPDGLLEEHSDPEAPQPVVAHLGTPYLTIRDANWWPDFPTSAKNIETLYERATGESISGVISFNVNVVEDILRTMDSIYLPELDETVSADTLVTLAQEHAEVGFEPGSTGKRDFLGELSEVLLGELFEVEGEDLAAIGQVFLQNMLKQNIAFYHSSDSAQDAFVATNLGGTLTSPEGFDYLKIVDSNVGANKSNYWVDRSTENNVSIDRNGNLSSHVSVTWTHRGDSETWPNGEYANYVRMYIPKDVDRIEVSDVLTDKKLYEESGYTVVAGRVNVPINSEVTLDLRYVLPEELGLSDDGVYQLYWDAQAGIDDTISVQVSPPTFLSLHGPKMRKATLTWPQIFEFRFSGIESIQKAQD